MQNFVDNYLHLTRYIESPTRYLKWGAYSCLSAALRDNVWFGHPYRNMKVFPNIYVIILSQESANTRKSNPLDINLALLRPVNGEVPITKIIAGDASMQGILKTLGGGGTNIPKGGSGYMVVKELKAGLILDEMSVSYLTNFYDFHEEYDKHIISYDLPKIKNLCFGMIGATNEVMAQQMMGVESKEGGLIGRTFIIHEFKRRLIDSGFEYHEYPVEDDWKPMKEYLRKLQQIRNQPMFFTEDARKLYNAWYHEFKPEDCHTKTGYEGRMGDAVQKMSIILSASSPDFFDPPEGRFKLISENVLNSAIEECTSLIPTYGRLTMGLGSDPDAKPIHQILRLFDKAPKYQMTRISLISTLHGNVSARKVDELMYDMVQAGNAIQCSIGNLPGWKLTEEYLRKIKKIPPKSNGAAG